jgi:hypothetical protein
VLLAGNDRLPEDEIGLFRQVDRNRGCQQAAGTQAPEGERRLALRAQPAIGQQGILSPGWPGSIRKVPTAVPATKQVDLQDMDSPLQRAPSPEAPPCGATCSSLRQTDADRGLPPVPSRLWLGGKRKTCARRRSAGKRDAPGTPRSLLAQLSLDKIDQRADRRKGRPFDFVVTHRKTETVFQCGQDRDNRHGIEFRHCAEERRTVSKAGRAAFKAENLVQDGQDFLLGSQTVTPESSFQVGAL